MKNFIFFSIILLILLGCASAAVIKKTDDKVIAKILDPPDIENHSNKPNLKLGIQSKIDNDIYDAVSLKNNSNNNELADIKNNNKKTSNSKINQKKSANTINIINVSDNTKEKNTEDLNDKKNNNDIQNIDLATVNLEKFKIDEKPIKEIQVGENQKFGISLSNSGWIIRKLYPDLIKIIKRENKDTNTLFQFQSTVACNVSIMFLRYNSPTNSIWRQVYNISVMPKLFNEVNDNITEETNNADKNSLNKEDANIVFDQTMNETKIKPDKKEKNKKSKDELNYKLEMANQQFNEKKYNEAESSYLELANSGETSSEINYKLGIIEKTKGNIDKSNEYFKKVIEEKDDIFYSEALLELMKNLQSQKKYLEAIDAYYKYAYGKNSNPLDIENLNLMLSDTYYNMNDYKNAGSEYRRFIKRFPDSQNMDKALYFLAKSLENLKTNPEFKEAYRLYKIIIDDYPESVYYNKSKDRIIYLERHYLKIN